MCGDRVVTGDLGNEAAADEPATCGRDGWRGSWMLSGKGPRQMTREGSIGVRWYVGDGGRTTEPASEATGDVADACVKLDGLTEDGLYVCEQTPAEPELWIELP